MRGCARLRAAFEPGVRASKVASSFSRRWYMGFILCPGGGQSCRGRVQLGECFNAFLLILWSGIDQLCAAILWPNGRVGLGFLVYTFSKNALALEEHRFGPPAQPGFAAGIAEKPP